jgi:hypothetical protein
MSTHQEQHMKHSIIAAALVFSAIGAQADHHKKGEAPAMSAEEMAMMKAMEAAATPGEPHKQLADSVGEFQAQMQMWPAPGAPPMNTSMQVKRKMDLGGRVLVEHWKGEVMGAAFEGRGRTGYDNVTKRYWSTWTDNMSTGLLVMYGQWNADNETFEFTGKNVHPATGTTYAVRSVGSSPLAENETMTMYEDHGQGEYKSMSFTLTRQ